MPRLPAALLLLLVAPACKDITSTIVGGTVSAGKEVTTGIVEGVEAGRKSGESVDGAVIVTNNAELAAHGGVVVHQVRPAAHGAEVVLAFENSGEAPLRVSGLEVLVLDPDGFVQRPLDPASALTVPPRARDQLVVPFGVPPERVRTVRVWTTDLPVPAPTPAAP